MKQIDLHVHSNQSDGTLTPAELVQLADSIGLSAFALTDHDNTNGISEAIHAAAAASVEVIPGIEFSTRYLERDIHIVGLEPDWKNPVFQKRLNYYQEERRRRNQEMIDKMAADGIQISFDRMKEAFGETIWTRAHFARFLTDNGYVPSMPAAFQTHIGENCKYFIPRPKTIPQEVTELLQLFHGIPILAHPFQYRLQEKDLRQLLASLREAGLIGIEVYYSTYTAEQTDYLLRLASEFDLLPSGGSDFHGTNKPTIALGTGQDNLAIPYKILEQLRCRKLEQYH